MKINDKVKVLRRNEAGQWSEYGSGVVRKLHTNKRGDNSYVSFCDKQWSNQLIEEILPIDSNNLKVVKF